jgi:hypothetical protein
METKSPNLIVNLPFSTINPFQSIFQHQKISKPSFSFAKSMLLNLLKNEKKTKAIAV